MGERRTTMYSLAGEPNTCEASVARNTERNGRAKVRLFKVEAMSAAGAADVALFARVAARILARAEPAEAELAAAG